MEKLRHRAVPLAGGRLFLTPGVIAPAMITPVMRRALMIRAVMITSCVIRAGPLGTRPFHRGFSLLLENNLSPSSARGGLSLALITRFGFTLAGFAGIFPARTLGAFGRPLGLRFSIGFRRIAAI